MFLLTPTGDVLSAKSAAGKLLIILAVETLNLSLNEPYNDFPASALESLNLIGLFSPVDCVTVVGDSVSIFKSSNVKKSENGAVLNDFESFSGMILSKAKLVLVN